MATKTAKKIVKKKPVKKVPAPKPKRTPKRYDVVLEVEGYDNERDALILSFLTLSQQRLHTGAGFGSGRRDLGFNCGKLETANQLKKDLLAAARKAKAVRPTVKVYTVDWD